MQIFSSIQSPQYRLIIIACLFVLTAGTALLIYSSRVITEIEQNSSYIEHLQDI